MLREWNTLRRLWVLSGPAMAIGLIVVLMAAAGSGSASQPFSPTLGVSLTTNLVGKPATVIVVTHIPGGQHPLDSMSLFPPAGWSVAGDRDVPDGDQVAAATMSADLGCDGVVDSLPGRYLLDTQVDDPEKKAEWMSSGSGWQFRVVVDQLQGGGHEISMILANASMPVPICAPQTFTLLINARSIPGDATVMANPTSPGVYTWSAIYVSLGLEHAHLANDTVSIVTSTPAPTATPAPTPTPTPVPADIDGDSIPNDVEQGCGSSPSNAGSLPERIDGIFSARDDDGDTQVDEPLPAGAAAYDCDRDGYKGTVENHVYAPSVRGDQDPCGSNASPPTSPPSPIGWPADLKAGSLSANKVTVEDLASFLVPVRYLGTNVGTNTGDIRWDLSPGKGSSAQDINIQDLAALLALAPMLGTRALNGALCPWP